MIKEYSINFNEKKIDLKAYKDHVGDLSLPYHRVEYYAFDGIITIDEAIANFSGCIKDYERQALKDSL